MEFSTLSEKIQQQYRSKKPFVVYVLPDDDMVTAQFQHHIESHNLPESGGDGFVFAPFQGKEIIYIPTAKSDTIRLPITATTIDTDIISQEENPIAKESYLTLVQHAIDIIKTKQVSKIVTSRTHEVELKAIDFKTVFHRLLHLYPTALRYVWYHPDTGLWMGATPEILVSLKDRKLRTMALAGTKPFINNETPHWSAKELKEQQWVTDDIDEKLQEICTAIKVSNTKNHIAGSLVHLRTDFEGTVLDHISLHHITKTLHPTPAVCGTPTQLALDFITQHEHYKRSFYTGFLGPVQHNSLSAQLYVNLRSASFSDQKVSIYVGGGVTIDSIPEDEWNETVHKMQTMLQVLAPLL